MPQQLTDQPRTATHVPFGPMLSACRFRCGFTQLELSLRTGVSIRHISFLERGRSRPSESMIARLASALQLGLSGEDELRMAAGLAPRSHNRVCNRISAHVSTDHVGTDLATHVFDTALHLNEASGARELIELARPLLARLGINYFFCGTLIPTLPINSMIAFDAEGAFPYAWLQRYREQQYRADDPLVREALHSTSAFFWEDVISRPSGLMARERHIIDEAGEFGIRSGFVVTIRRGDGTIRAVSMMGQHVEARDSAVRVALRTVGTCLLDAQERLGSPARAPEMTSEALDCLRWTLEDKSPRQIAEKLGLGIKVIRSRLRSACVELGVRDRHQAAARAVALRLIRSD